MVLVTIRMQIPPKRHDEVTRTINSIASGTRIQQGCLGFSLYRDENDICTYMVEEVWKTQADLERYLKTDDYRHMLLVMEMASDAPEVKFQTITSIAGMEVVEKVRACRMNEEE